MCEEDTEQTHRRRSARIVALEEKREKEKKAKALARKNNPDNNVSGNKGKGKAVIDEDYDFIDDSDEEEDDDEEQYVPTRKRGRKSKALHQLISSTQPMQEEQNPENRSTSRNVSPRMPEKHVLQFVLDLLQRKDPDELFAEPVNGDEVQDYYRIVKQPMDFATIRAKLHENLYTTLEQFKRDVFRICSNAIKAEAIAELATKVFHGLEADPEHFDLEFSLNKRRRGRKPRTPRRFRLPPKPDGTNRDTNNTIPPELEKRQMYMPPSDKSLLSEIVNGPQPNFQPNKPSSNYEDSLLRFVEDLGPAAQTVAAKKLETLRFHQILNGETPRSNPLANFSEHTSQSISQEPTQPDAANNAYRHSRALSLSNRPLAIPGAAPAVQENININTIDRVNLRDGATYSYKGKRACLDEGWDACAAALLGNIFLNYDNGGSSSGFKGKSSNGSGSMDNWIPPAKDNVSSLLVSLQEATNQNQGLQLGGSNLTGKSDQWNTTVGTSNLINNFMSNRDVTPRSNRVRSQVWPTSVISGPQPKPLEHIHTNNLSEISILAQQRPAESMSGINHPGLSLFSQSRPQDSISGYKLSGSSLMSQLKPEDPLSSYNFSRQSSLSQLKPAESMMDYNLSGQSLSQLKPVESMTGYSLSSFYSQLKPAEPMTGNNLPEQSISCQLKPAESITGYNLSDPSLYSQLKPVEPMTANNLSGQFLWSQLKPAEPMSDNNFSGQSILPSQAANLSKWNEPDTSYYGLSNPYQHEAFQELLGSSNFNNSPYPVQASNEQMLNQEYTPPTTYGYSDLPMQFSQLNPLGLFSQQEPKSSSALQMPAGGAMNYHGGTALAGQPGEATAYLLWDDNQQPNLALQL